MVKKKNPAPLAATPDVVFLQPPPVLRVLTPAAQVDMLDGDRLVLTNIHGRAVITLESGSQRLAVDDAEPTEMAWMQIQVSRVWGQEELRIDGGGDG